MYVFSSFFSVHMYGYVCVCCIIFEIISMVLLYASFTPKRYKAPLCLHGFGLTTTIFYACALVYVCVFVCVCMCVWECTHHIWMESHKFSASSTQTNSKKSQSHISLYIALSLLSILMTDFCFLLQEQTN